MTKSPVLVLVGPTAVGKGTVVERLRSLFPQVAVAISATTRKPRPGELDGVHYLFVNDEEFEEMINQNAFLEWATVHGSAKYGTPRTYVEEQRQAGKPVILEIDLEGARQVRKTLPDALFVFLEPPSWAELERRLIGRGTETPEQRECRLRTARLEMDARDEFDMRVTNDNVEDAARELADLMGLG